MNNVKNEIKKWFFNGIILLIIVFSISLNFKQCTSIKTLNSNIIGLSDTIKTTKNKLGEIVKSKGLLLLDIDDLKNINSSLTEEINKLSKKDKRNLIEINKLSLYIDMLKDSIIVLQPDGTVYVNDTTYDYTFSKNTKWRELEWNVRVVDGQKNTVTSTVLKDKVFADIVIGKKEEKGKLILFASSSNPSVNIQEIEGSVIDLTAYNKFQKKKQFGLGLHVGYGLSTNNGIVFISPYIGVGLSYNLFNF